MRILAQPAAGVGLDGYPAPSTFMMDRDPEPMIAWGQRRFRLSLVKTPSALKWVAGEVRSPGQAARRS